MILYLKAVIHDTLRYITDTSNEFELHKIHPSYTRYNPDTIRYKKIQSDTIRYEKDTRRCKQDTPKLHKIQSRWLYLIISSCIWIVSCVVLGCILLASSCIFLVSDCLQILIQRYMVIRIYTLDTAKQSADVYHTCIMYVSVVSSLRCESNPKWLNSCIFTVSIQFWYVS